MRRGFGFSGGGDLGGAGGGGFLHEINVTPFVDVALVLLVVFMVTAPLLSTGVSVDLPRAEAEVLGERGEPLTLTVGVGGRVYIQDAEVLDEDLESKLRAIAEGGYEGRVYVRGDEGASYGRVLEILARVSRSGFVRVALVTKRASGGGR